MNFHVEMDSAFLIIKNVMATLTAEITQMNIGIAVMFPYYTEYVLMI